MPEHATQAQVRDPDKVCGDLWFNGTPAQRAGFGEGAEGRGRSEHPPKAWWDDCLRKVQASAAIRKAAARFAGPATLRGTTIRGPILAPGTYTPHVDGEPLTVTFSKSVILAAYKRLKARVDAGGVEIRLTHPDLQGLPLKFGLIKEVRLDEAKGEVWLTEGVAYPEMEKLLTDKARASLQELALSMAGPIELEGSDEDGWVATRIDVTHVDVVDKGAFNGAWIVPSVPAGLAAQAANATPARTATFRFTPSGDRGGFNAKRRTGVNAQMPKIEDASMVPDDVRAQLDNDDAKIVTYISAYNAAIEAGKTPLEAHEAGLAKALQDEDDGEIDAAEEDDEKRKEKKSDAKAKGAKAQATAAAAAVKERDKLHNEVKTLKAELAARDATKRTVEARVADLEAKTRSLEAEKAEALAVKDVEDAIVKARKATPAERDALLMVRRKAGAEAFQAMIEARMTVAPPVGELGLVPNDPAHSDPVIEAAATVQKYGLQGVFNAGLVEVDAALRTHLAASHPTDPLVRKHCAAELAAIAAHGARNGKRVVAAAGGDR